MREPAAEGRLRRVLRAAARLDRRHDGDRAGAENLVTLLRRLELLSIPLYVLCAIELRREEARSRRGSST